jgi:calcineurin-like phosphoesterase family protein
MKIQINNKQNIFFCSDPHYGHSGIVMGTSNWDNKSGCRPFDTIEDMNSVLVNNINSVVGKNDILFCLGDWSFGSYKTGDNITNIKKFREQIECENVHLIFGNHDCFDKKETEILTEDGWMLFEDWKVFKPKIASYDIEKETTFFEDPLDIHESYYSGVMYSIKNRLVDLFITPNHRLYINKQNKKTKDYAFTQVNELPYKNIPITLKSASNNINDGVLISDELIALTAWILSDGSVKETLYGVSYVIYQSEGKDKIVRDLLNDCGVLYKETERNRKISHITGKELKSEPKKSFEFHIGQKSILEKLITSKYSFPKWLRKLDKRQFDIFFKHYVLGDGTKQKESSYAVYGTINVLSQLQELCFLNGHRTILRKYRNSQYVLDITHNYKTSHISRFKDSTEILNYTGEIFCFKTLNSTLVIRRNGKVSIVGNSEIIANKDNSKYWFSSTAYYREIVIIEQPLVQGKKATKQKIVLSHYSHRVWNGMHNGDWMLFGHSHGNLKEIEGKTMDVGFDTNNLKPYSYQDIKGIMNTKQIVKLDHHE